MVLDQDVLTCFILVYLFLVWPEPVGKLFYHYYFLF